MDAKISGWCCYAQVGLVPNGTGTSTSTVFNRGTMKTGRQKEGFHGKKTANSPKLGKNKKNTHCRSRFITYQVSSFLTRVRYYTGS